MSRRSTETRNQILAAADKLFSQQGYGETTIDEIVKEAQCSKGTFYHYFEGKEEVASAPELYDKAYSDWYREAQNSGADAISMLREMNQVFLRQLETMLDLERASATCRFEASTQNSAPYISNGRVYNRILHAIIQKGQAQHEIRDDISFIVLSHIYALVQRGIIFDWCIYQGSYSILEFGLRTMEIMLCGFLPGASAGALSSDH